jgi:ankyrin repeat protein
MLIEHGADVTAQTKDGKTPLHGVSSPGIARILIEHGADVTARTKDGETPLHRASSLEVARMLIEHGADVAAQTKDGETPLHWVLSPEVARVLIDCGADVAAKNKDGNTPLHLMSIRGQTEDDRMLTGRDTDQNEDENIPLYPASTSSDPYEAQRRANDSLEVSRMLLEFGADVNAQNKFGLTPFRLASEAGLAEVTRVLLEYGADPGANDNID